MKKWVKLAIDPKKLHKMSGESKRVIQDCAMCLEDIQKTVDVVLSNIESEFREQRNKMTDEWNTFLAVSDEKLSNSIVMSDQKLNQSIAHSEKETDQLNTNSRWILAIVLGVTFCLGAVVGYTWNQMGTKADKDKVMTINEYKFLHDLTRAYNANQFIQNPDAKVDSTNYELIVNAVLAGKMRGGVN